MRCTIFNRIAGRDLPENNTDAATPIVEPNHVSSSLKILVVAVGVHRHRPLLLYLVKLAALSSRAGDLGDLRRRGCCGCNADSGYEDTCERNGKGEEAHVVVALISDLNMKMIAV